MTKGTSRSQKVLLGVLVGIAAVAITVSRVGQSRGNGDKIGYFHPNTMLAKHCYWL
jgi:hypothetical protein